MNSTAAVLLDTDILSGIMRRKPRVFQRAERYLKFHGFFSFSTITRYEIVRGLLAKEATAQQKAFDRLCAASRVLPLDDATVDIAAAIYAGLHRRGELIGDADILIAATAISRGMAVATNNERHFRRIPGLTIENWLA